MPEQSSKLSFYAESMIAGAPFRAIIKFAVPLIFGYILEHKNYRVLRQEFAMQCG